MLINDQALAFLYQALDGEEESASEYWKAHGARFAVDENGAVSGDHVLGQMVEARGLIHKLAHYLLQTPFRWMGRPYPFFRQAERLGRLVAKRQGRVYTADIQRQALTLAVCHRFVSPLSPSDAILAIGDGFGNLSSLFGLAYPNNKTICVNLNKPLMLDIAGYQAAVPNRDVALVRTIDELSVALSSDSVGLIAVQADNAAILAAAPIGLAANVVSMQEMDYPTIHGYFDILRNNPAEKTFFYCCNKQSKQFADAPEIIFDNYGWEDGDDILLEEPCPWSMLMYSGRPPFYQRRTWNLIRHRMANMQKTPKA